MSKPWACSLKWIIESCRGSGSFAFGAMPSWPAPPAKGKWRKVVSANELHFICLPVYGTCPDILHGVINILYLMTPFEASDMSKMGQHRNRGPRVSFTILELSQPLVRILASESPFRRPTPLPLVLSCCTQLIYLLTLTTSLVPFPSHDQAEMPNVLSQI